MKYNLSEIMKNAWSMMTDETLWSECLKESWKQAKINNIKKEFTFTEKFKKSSYFQTSKRWTKNGNDRLYIPRNAYEQAGYIDLNTMSFKATRPGNESILREALELLK